MLFNNIRRAFVLPMSAAALMAGLFSAAGVAFADPRSMSSLMHLDHAADIRPISAAEANTIFIKEFHFAPMSLTVPVGATVTWENLDGEPHTVVSIEGVFRSGGLDQDDRFAFKFDKPGTYKFLCSIHPQMLGTIIVK